MRVVLKHDKKLTKTQKIGWNRIGIQITITRHNKIAQNMKEINSI